MYVCVGGGGGGKEGRDRGRLGLGGAMAPLIFLINIYVGKNFSNFVL